MLLAIDKHGALQILASPQEAETHFEAIDVEDRAFEFCDTDGQRYEARYIRQAKRGRWTIDIGAFQLVLSGAINENLPREFIKRAGDVESSTVLGVETLRDLKDRLR